MESKGNTDLGPVYTKGASFRALAEKRQREYRAEILRVGWSKQGHWLDEDAVKQGANFVTPAAFDAAKIRDTEGKGVGPRTFRNMLSSQAMCFNIFAPLAQDFDLASKVLKRSLPWLDSVKSINIEYTPSNEIFGDQSGFGGVDCDVLIEATSTNGEGAVVVIETKFVEPEFSTCSFCTLKRIDQGKPSCGADIPVETAPEKCLYESLKGYRYWQRTNELGTLSDIAMPADSCPFFGPLWQLWLNHVLAHAEAKRRNSPRAVFAVLAPTANDALIRNGTVFDQFTNLLSSPKSFAFMALDDVIEALADATSSSSESHREWTDGLKARYASIKD